MPLSPEEQAQLEALTAKAAEPEPEAPPEADDLAAAAADLGEAAADMAEAAAADEGAEADGADVVVVDTPDPMETAVADVMRTEAAADAEVAIIEARAEADVKVAEAVAAAEDRHDTDITGDESVIGDGDSDPESRHWWFGKRRNLG